MWVWVCARTICCCATLELIGSIQLSKVAGISQSSLANACMLSQIVSLPHTDTHTGHTSCPDVAPGCDRQRCQHAHPEKKKNLGATSSYVRAASLMNSFPAVVFAWDREDAGGGGGGGEVGSCTRRAS